MISRKTAGKETTKLTLFSKMGNGETKNKLNRHFSAITLLWLIYYLDYFFSCILVRVRAQFHFVRVHYLLISLTCVFSSLNNVLILLCIIFLTHIYVLS